MCRRDPQGQEIPDQQQDQSTSSRSARATAAVRDETPSRVRMLATWRCTVCSLRKGRFAMSRSFIPCATK